MPGLKVTTSRLLTVEDNFFWDCTDEAITFPPWAATVIDYSKQSHARLWRGVTGSVINFPLAGGSVADGEDQG